MKGIFKMNISGQNKNLSNYRLELADNEGLKKYNMKLYAIF